MLRYGSRLYNFTVLKKGIKRIFGTLWFTPNCGFNTKSVQMVRYFLRTIYGLFRYGTIWLGRYDRVRYGTLKNSDKNVLPTVI